jgi:predicted aspartyl protease
MRGILLGLLVLMMPAFARAAEQPYRIGHYGRLVTDVYVNGQGPFAFLIDTASSRSLIYEHLRRKLNLGPSQPQQLIVYGINDVAQVMPVKPDRLAIAGQEVTDLTLGVLPDSEANPPDGILGTDVLARYFLVLDRARMRLDLLPPAPDSAKPFEGWPQARLTARPLKRFPISFWYLSARFNNHNFTTLFDLGAATTMINWEAAERLGVRKRRFASFGPPPEDLQDVLGKVSPAVRVEDLEVRLPGQTWDNQLAVIADAPVFGYFDLEERPAAIVGPGLLRDNSLAVDFARGRLFVGPKQRD